MPLRTKQYDSAGNGDGLLLEDQLCFPLYAASRLMTRLYQLHLEPHGLTYPQYVVLMILWEDAPCSVSHICDRVLLNSNTLTPLLKRLEQLGYVNRSRSSADERVVEISLTKPGQALREQCVCIPQTLLEDVGFAPGDIGKLKKLLEKFIGAVEEAG